MTCAHRGTRAAACGGDRALCVVGPGGRARPSRLPDQAEARGDDARAQARVSVTAGLASCGRGPAHRWTGRRHALPLDVVFPAPRATPPPGWGVRPRSALTRPCHARVVVRVGREVYVRVRTHNRYTHLLLFSAAAVAVAGCPGFHQDRGRRCQRALEPPYPHAAFPAGEVAAASGAPPGPLQAQPAQLPEPLAVRHHVQRGRAARARCDDAAGQGGARACGGWQRGDGGA